MKELWEKLDHDIKKECHQIDTYLEIMTHVNAGLTPEQIHEFQKALGYHLPTDFVESLAVHDGVGERGDIFTDWRLLPSKDILVAHKHMEDMAKQEARYNEGEDIEYAGDIGVEHTNWNPRWIPFAGNGEGDYLCLDLSPARWGTMGQVIEVAHDSNYITLVTKSYKQFFKNSADSYVGLINAPNRQTWWQKLFGKK